MVSDATFLPGPDLVCNTCREIDFFTDFFPGTDTIGYGVAANMGTYYFYFTPDAFETNGVHNSILVPVNVGTLAVSGVPEPSAFWLLLIAVAAIFKSAKKRSTEGPASGRERNSFSRGRYGKVTVAPRSGSVCEDVCTVSFISTKVQRTRQD